MARPKATDPVVNKPVGLPESLWPKVDAAAKRRGLSRSALFAKLVSDALGINRADPQSHDCPCPVNRRIEGVCALCGRKA